jgi:hypothetical protein
MPHSSGCMQLETILIRNLRLDTELVSWPLLNIAEETLSTQLDQQMELVCKALCHMPLEADGPCRMDRVWVGAEGTKFFAGKLISKAFNKLIQYLSYIVTQ